MIIEKLRILTRYDRYEKSIAHREKHPESEVETDDAVELDLSDDSEHDSPKGQYPGLYNRQRKQPDSEQNLETQK